MVPLRKGEMPSGVEERKRIPNDSDEDAGGRPKYACTIVCYGLQG